MTPNRFQDAKRIYASALEREPAQRDAYISEACGGDEALRKEVESLLGCRTEAQEFFKAPAVEVGAKALAREAPTDFTGRTVAHYAILQKLGEGGMGVVYKAQDTHLDRFVALKVLPHEKVADPERKQRFVREAKAASALNHPNIVTIHDIDTADGVTFMAMEFVKGETLDRLIRGRGIALNETLKHAVQIAEALTAAHAAGIIHRDIKPANIMVTETGTVKVLDFGLAKLTGPPESAGAGTARSTEPKTEPGLILGTAAYMSPEQAEGKEVDARSDIFSFGSVLYEMVTGRRAFSGETNASTLAAILREEPKPVSQVSLDTPRELERVISRCLRKDPEGRFQHMADLGIALKELKEQSDAGVLASAPRRRSRLVRSAGALLVAAALGLGGWFGLFRWPLARPVAKVSTFTALPGQQSQPALSPEGKQVAFVWNSEKRGTQDNYDIYVQLVGEATPRRLTNNPAFDYSPVWSPDALHIAFLRNTPAGTEVIVVPSAGGAEKRLLVSTASCRWESLARQYCGLAWSPDGKSLAIVDKESPQAPNSIFLFNIETREKRKLTAPPSGSEDGVSAFSPDGRMLAFARRPFPNPLSDIYVLPLSESSEPRGEPGRITRDNTFIYGLDWTGDGRGIVFASQRGGVPALWQVAGSGGPPERLSVAGTDALWPSVSRKGDRLAYTYGMPDVNVWRVAAPGGSAAAGPAATPIRITQSPQIDMQPAFSPDGTKIAWSSMHSGSHQIWVSNNDGSEPQELTRFDPPGAALPLWSPDGRYIAFSGFSRGPRQVYVVPAEGGAPRRPTTGEFDEIPAIWSRDGRWIYFVSNRREGDGLWKVPAGGGSPLLVARNGRLAVESSDGKFVYYSAAGEGIWKVAAGGGSPLLLAPTGRRPFSESFDGKFLYYSGPDASIWRVAIDGGGAAPVLKKGDRASWVLSAAGIHVLDPDAKGGPAIHFLPFAAKGRETVGLPGPPDSYVEPLRGLAASPDGRWLLYLHQDGHDPKIMLVENFQ